MKRYFQICLFSPLWFPVLLGGLMALGYPLLDHFGAILPEWLVFAPVVVVYSLIFGGVQYFIALCIVWTRIDFERTRSWITGILWLPIIFTPIQFVGMLLVAWGDWNLQNGLGDLGWIVAYDLALGYGYVLCWLLGYWLLRNLGVWERKEPYEA